MDFSFRSDYNFLFIAAIFIIAFIISYFFYKKTKLEGFQKKLYTALRFLSLFFILLLLSSPILSFIRNVTDNPINIYLIDNSQSLLLEKRDAKVHEILQDKLKNSSGADNLFFLFSGNLYKEINKNEFESISYEGINNFQTNLTGTLYSLQERLSNKNLSTINIISDGIINEGGNPSTVARALNVPVNYFLAGDTIQKKDLVLKNVFYNKTAFIESAVPVNIEINSFDYDRDIKINLYEEDKLIETKNVKVTGGQNIYPLSFSVMSGAEKVIKYKAEVAGLDDEITLKNNYQEFFIKFVNNKFKVLVLAGGPSADLSFITAELKKVKNFETTILTQKSGTEFYEGVIPDLSSFDAYVFAGYPTSITNQNILNAIKDNLEKNNSSLLFLSSRNIDYRKLVTLESRLPFKLSSISENEVETGIKTVNLLNNEIFKNATLFSGINSLPSIFKTAAVFSINPSAETFLITTRNSEPAFVIQNTEKNKSAAFLAYGVYKWRLTSQKNDAEEILNYILTSSIVAITSKEEKKKFTIETTKPVYSKFENVSFTARITNFELQGGEAIKVKITGNGYNKELQLIKKDNRYYEGELNVPTEGDYEYTGGLYSKDILVESTQNRFTIGENNNEYKLTRADNTILSLLSNETGGKNFTGSNPSEIQDSLKNQNQKSRTEYKSRKNFELNVNPFYLGILIFLLCLEWFLRKRNNLP